MADFYKNPSPGPSVLPREIVWAMDGLLEKDPDHAKIEIIAPQGTPAPEGLENIGFRTCGKRQGHAWEQWDLYRATCKGTLLSFTNSGPVLHPEQLVVIHDVAPYRMPEDFSFSYRTFHKLLGCLLALHSRIATVSEFSKNELAAILGIDAARIPVLHNGHEHILRSVPDNAITGKLGLQDKPYFLFVGSPVPRKNLAMAVEAFKALGREDISFVIVGASNSKVFRESPDVRSDNVILSGRLSDEEIVGLYTNALALVFPSLYEGFGIPPLEAMVHGCPVLAADIPPVKEVCGEAAIYYSPHDPAECTHTLKEFLGNPQKRDVMIQKGKERAPIFSWEVSAAKLLEELTGEKS